MRFAPDDQSLIVCGMGDMKDPMAGNGKQLWQRWSWLEAENKKLSETKQGESGEGLMEALAFHPSGECLRWGAGFVAAIGTWPCSIWPAARGSERSNRDTGSPTWRLLQMASDWCSWEHKGSQTI